MTKLNQLFQPAALDMPHPFLKDGDGGALMVGEPLRIKRKRFNQFRVWAQQIADASEPLPEVQTVRRESFLDRQRRRAEVVL